MLPLDVLDKSWVGIAAFYSIIHVSLREVPRALAERAACWEGRALAPLGVSPPFAVGGQTIPHLDEWWGQPVSVDFHSFSDRKKWPIFCVRPGLRSKKSLSRDPYPEVEHPSRRSCSLRTPPQARRMTAKRSVLTRHVSAERSASRARIELALTAVAE